MTSVPMVTIGKGAAAMQVSPISFGCMGLTAAYGNEPKTDEEAIAVLRAAYNLGIRHFDTAQIYVRQKADGTLVRNEEVVGKFLKTLSPAEKKDVTVATKFFGLMDKGKLFWDEDRYIEETKKSRERLGVDSIDLYYFHRIYPKEICSLENWMAAAKRAKAEGLIKRLGLSEASSEVITKANEIMPITCVQQEWSLFARDLEETIVPTCKQLGVGIIAYSPVGRGILTGGIKKDSKITDWRKSVPYFTEKNLNKNLKLIDDLKAIADKKGCSVAQLCLSWVIKKGAVPIPGTTNVKHLEENMRALDVDLTTQEMKQMEEIGSSVVGERGDEEYMKRTFQTNSL